MFKNLIILFSFLTITMVTSCKGNKVANNKKNSFHSQNINFRDTYHSKSSRI